MRSQRSCLQPEARLDMDAFVVFPLVGGLFGAVLGYREWSVKVKIRSAWAGSPPQLVAQGLLLGVLVGGCIAAVVSVLLR